MERASRKLNVVNSERHAPTASPAPSTLPAHVAIIMDGNGRWAKARGLDRSDGHKAGVDAARNAVSAARDAGLRYLTLYSFSTENWRRPASEVRDLMNLLRQFIGEDLPKLRDEGVRVRILGDKSNLTPDLKLLVSRAEAETRHNDSHFLQIAFNYGGRDEIARAARQIAKDVREKKLHLDDIDEARFSEYLDTADIPDPDLVVRTSGELRTSNFLTWQAAYAEYYFTDVLWPDFTAETLAEALAAFASRDRRYGGSE